MLTAAQARAQALIHDAELGVSTDTATGLMWQDSAVIRQQFLQFDAARAFCGQLVLAKYDDWRLPNLYELLSTVDNAQAFHITGIRQDFAYRFFETVFHAYFWAATESLYGTGSDPLRLNYHQGFESAIAKHYEFAVRCVR